MKKNQQGRREAQQRHILNAFNFTPMSSAIAQLYTSPSPDTEIFHLSDFHGKGGKETKM